VRGPVAGPLIGDRDRDPYFVAGRRVAAPRASALARTDAHIGPRVVRAVTAKHGFFPPPRPRAACAFSLRLVAWSHIWHSSSSNVLLNRGLERVRELSIDLAVAKLRHIAGTRWSTKRYPNMELLRQRNAITAQLEHATDKSAKESGHYRLQIR
jgi:hypothetical protein